MRVSHETIYRTLFVQAREALRKELTACLRTGRTQRRPHMRTEQSGTGRLRNMILISDRPPEAEDRAVPRQWEGDLIIGKGARSAIGTLVERSSRYVILLHLPDGRTAEDVRGADAADLQAACRASPHADLRLHSAAHLNAVARELNNRPRQTLNWMKPSEVFYRSVASTA